MAGLSKYILALFLILIISFLIFFIVIGILDTSSSITLKELTSKCTCWKLEDQICPNNFIVQDPADENALILQKSCDDKCISAWQFECVAKTGNCCDVTFVRIKECNGDLYWTLDTDLPIDHIVLAALDEAKDKEQKFEIELDHANRHATVSIKYPIREQHFFGDLFLTAMMTELEKDTKSLDNHIGGAIQKRVWKLSKSKVAKSR